MTITTEAKGMCPTDAKFTCRCSNSDEAGIYVECKGGDLESVKENMQLLKEFGSMTTISLNLQENNMTEIPANIFMGTRNKLELKCFIDNN